MFRKVNKDYFKNTDFVQQLFKIYLRVCKFLTRKQETYDVSYYRKYWEMLISDSPQYSCGIKVYKMDAISVFMSDILLQWFK